MTMPNHLAYPINLSLAGRHCLIVGFGAVGCRKLRGLLPCQPGSILILDKRELSDLTLDARDLALAKNVTFETRACEYADVAKSFLVFAATNNDNENGRISAICAELNVLCDNCSNPWAGSFTVPATARSDGLLATISTGGQTPLLAGIWRRELEQWLEGRNRLAWLMGRLRPLVLSLPGAHRQIFLTILHSPLRQWLESGDHASCRQWLSKSIPDLPADSLEKIFNDYGHTLPG